MQTLTEYSFEIMEVIKKICFKRTVVQSLVLVDDWLSILNYLWWLSSPLYTLYFFGQINIPCDVRKSYTFTL